MGFNSGFKGLIPFERNFNSAENKVLRKMFAPKREEEI
jgi:hypothetical protein